MTVYEGMLTAEGLRIGIVIARWNSFIVERLKEGALDAVRRHGGDVDAVDIAYVPGSFEIPLAAKRMAGGGAYDAVICLGAVIRGSTDHYEYVASEVTKGISHVTMETGVPVVFGVLTTDTIEQAVERAGTKAGNKGFEAATAAFEMANLLRVMP